MDRITEEKVLGMPVLINKNEAIPKTVRIRVKKRGIKHLKFSKLDARKKQALMNLLEKGPPFTSEKKRDAGIEAGFSDKPSVAVRAMDRILARKPIFDLLDKESEKKYEKKADEKVAEALVESLEATHPLSKDDKKDYKAIVNAAKEINKVRDNYPPKRVDIREMVFNVHWTGDDVRAAEEYKELVSEES